MSEIVKFWEEMLIHEHVQRIFMQVEGEHGIFIFFEKQTCSLK